jgi:hypothetical protein
MQPPGQSKNKVAILPALEDRRLSAEMSSLDGLDVGAILARIKDIVWVGVNELGGEEAVTVEVQKVVPLAIFLKNVQSKLSGSP